MLKKPKPKPKPRKKKWLVEVMYQDRQDDEVWMVTASSKVQARKNVLCHTNVLKESVGRIVPARGGTAAERELAKSFRTYTTMELS